jgi:hypothetical protein
LFKTSRYLQLLETGNRGAKGVLWRFIEPYATRGLFIEPHACGTPNLSKKKKKIHMNPRVLKTMWRNQGAREVATDIHCKADLPTLFRFDKIIKLHASGVGEKF